MSESLKQEERVNKRDSWKGQRQRANFCCFVVSHHWTVAGRTLPWHFLWRTPGLIYLQNLSSLRISMHVPLINTVINNGWLAVAGWRVTRCRCYPSPATSPVTSHSLWKCRLHLHVQGQAKAGTLQPWLSFTIMLYETVLSNSSS